MRKVEHYICEVCGTEYKDKAVCEKCEKSHKKAEGICGARYISIEQNASVYPVSVDIEFDNGEVKTYKRG